MRKFNKSDLKRQVWEALSYGLGLYRVRGEKLLG